VEDARSCLAIYRKFEKKIEHWIKDGEKEKGKK
jgi:hypothetical protein